MPDFNGYRTIVVLPDDTDSIYEIIDLRVPLGKKFVLLGTMHFSDFAWANKVASITAERYGAKIYGVIPWTDSERGDYSHAIYNAPVTSRKHI